MAPRLVPLISAAIAIVLQIVVAPLISFSSVVPNIFGGTGVGSFDCQKG